MMISMDSYNDKIKELAVSLFDADFDDIKRQVAYMTSAESVYALGCDYEMVGADVLRAISVIRAERAAKVLVTNIEIDGLAKSKCALTEQLEGQGFNIVKRVGRVWCVRDAEGHTMRIAITAHADGTQADYEILSVNDHGFHPDWSVEPLSFNHVPVYPSRKLTEIHLLALDNERQEILADYDIFHAVEHNGIGHSMYMHLGKLAGVLKRDLEYFDSIDSALESAVKVDDHSYHCGATSEVCHRSNNTDGFASCVKCPIGIELRKSWDGLPVLMDDC